MYNRDEQVWDDLTAVGLDFLIERARLRKVTSYTELNTVLARRTGQPPFNFDEASERAAMGHLLGLIVEASFDPDKKLMISALVHYLDRNDAGPGFYALAANRGLLSSGASPHAKWEFWVDQVSKVHDFYAGSGVSVPGTGVQ